MGRGFINTYPAAATLSVNSKWLFQLCVLGSSFLQDGDVGVGVVVFEVFDDHLLGHGDLDFARDGENNTTAEGHGESDCKFQIQIEACRLQLVRGGKREVAR